MKRSIRKLHSARGATFIFALAVFLIMTLFCFAIVSVSLTGAQNARAQQTQEQAFLTVRSAARLLQDALEGDGMKRERTAVTHVPASLSVTGKSWTAEDQYARGWLEAKTATVHQSSYSNESTDISHVFQEAAVQLVQALDEDPSAASASRKLTVTTAVNQDGAKALADVDVTLTMYPGYGITAVLSTGAGGSGYTMTLWLEAAVTQSAGIPLTSEVRDGDKTYGYQTITVTTTYFTWTATSVRGGDHVDS